MATGAPALPCPPPVSHLWERRGGEGGEAFGGLMGHQTKGLDQNATHVGVIYVNVVLRTFAFL